ncbi:hypothetical protein KAR91_77995 [Candidatus Pacearchaeota archaeon]|nr:hypothetical protein [Candidatus Pacearchaeota archaeon]
MIFSTIDKEGKHTNYSAEMSSRAIADIKLVNNFRFFPMRMYTNVNDEVMVINRIFVPVGARMFYTTITKKLPDGEFKYSTNDSVGSDVRLLTMIPATRELEDEFDEPDPDDHYEMSVQEFLLWLGGGKKENIPKAPDGKKAFPFKRFVAHGDTFQSQIPSDGVIAKTMAGVKAEETFPELNPDKGMSEDVAKKAGRETTETAKKARAKAGKRRKTTTRKKK